MDNIAEKSLPVFASLWCWYLNPQDEGIPDSDYIISGVLLLVFLSIVGWYAITDELERRTHERCLRDTKRRLQRSNSTAEQTGSRCKSAKVCGCGDASRDADG